MYPIHVKLKNREPCLTNRKKKSSKKKKKKRLFLALITLNHLLFSFLKLLVIKPQAKMTSPWEEGVFL